MSRSLRISSPTSTRVPVIGVRPSPGDPLNTCVKARNTISMLPRPACSAVLRNWFIIPSSHSKLGTPDGWNPSGVPSFEWLEGMINQFRKTAEHASRGNMEIVLRAFTHVLSGSPGDGRTPMTGTRVEVGEDMRRLRDMGVTHLIHSPAAIGFDPRASIDDMLAVMQQLIEISA